MTYKPDVDALVRKANDLLSNNEQVGAFTTYKKAANVLMEQGKYFQVFEIYDIMARIYKDMGKIGEMIGILNEVAIKLEDFKINDVAAKFHERAGNLSYDLQDFTTASMHYEKAAEQYRELFLQEGDDSLQSLSGVLLMKAGESLFHRKKDRAEDLLMQGIFRYCGVKTTLREMERDLHAALNKGNMARAMEITTALAAMMAEVIDKVSFVKNFDVERLADSVTSRLLHFKAEYLLLEYLITRQFPDRDAREIGARARERIAEGLAMLGEIMRVKHDKEDVDRYCFDAMLQEVLDVLEGNAGNSEVRNLEDNFTGTLKEAISDNPYRALLSRIRKFGLDMVKQDLAAANLGRFNAVKGTFIKLLYAGRGNEDT